MRLVQESSETWTRPSMPGSSSTNAPYGTRFVTLPLTFMLTGYFSAILSHGLSVFCLRPSETRSFSRSMSSTSTSTSWPTLSISLGWLSRLQLMSVMWSRPSRPSRSMNAPKSVMFLTVPLTVLPFSMPPSSFARFSARSASMSSRRERTTFLRSSFSLTILHSRVLPSYTRRSLGAMMSTWLPGRNASTPTLSMRPPLTTALTLPVMSPPLLKILTIFSQFCFWAAFSLERTTMPSSFSRRSSSTSTSLPISRSVRRPRIRSG